jgi:hypothetical protein
VLVRNELKTSKMDDEFKEEAVVIKKEENDVYEVFTNDGKTLRRHAVQLRHLKKGSWIVRNLWWK